MSLNLAFSNVMCWCMSWDVPWWCIYIRWGIYISHDLVLCLFRISPSIFKKRVLHPRCKGDILLIVNRIIHCFLLTSPSIFQSILCCTSYFSWGFRHHTGGSTVCCLQLGPCSVFSIHAPVMPIVWSVCVPWDRLSHSLQMHSRIFCASRRTPNTHTSEPTRGLVNYAEALKSAERENRSVREGSETETWGTLWWE